MAEYRGGRGVEEFYRVERERIIASLEAERRQCEKAGLFVNDPELRKELQTLFIGLEAAIKIINGGSTIQVIEENN